MKPLIDADILLYEIGFSGQFKGDEGEELTSNFDRVAELLDKKIEVICDEVEATEPPTLYITGDELLVNQLLKHPLEGTQSPAEYAPNFRYGIATTKPYKGTRKSDKPDHYYNLRAYMVAAYDCVVSTAWEADDQMAMDQMKAGELLCKYLSDDLPFELEHEPPMTIICSRDKDLRMVPGWHYSWECGRQASMGPMLASGNGFLMKKNDGKVVGWGPVFFYYQLLIGDTVDNIPGLKGYGTVKSYDLLKVSFTTERDIYNLVRGLYEEVMGDDWKEYFKEQAYLLWMVKELDKDGKPVMFTPPKKED